MNVNPFSYLIEKLKGKVDKSGDTMSGKLIVDQKNGTVGATAYSAIELGNNIPQGTDKNSFGVFRIYGKKQYYVDIKAPDIDSIDKDIVFPNKSGTLALTSDIFAESTSTISVSAGVTATENVLSKSGVVTTLILSTNKITPNSNGWINLGTIPTGFRPKRTFDFVCVNNETENSYLVITGRIGSNGSLFVWGINGTPITPHIALTYQS